MGVYSLYAAMNHKKINIYSFEVYTPTFYLMYENIKLNDFKNITPINAGLFKETKMTELVINDERAAGSEIKLLKIQKNFLIKFLQYHSTTSLTCLIYLILSILKLM